MRAKKKIYKPIVLSVRVSEELFHFLNVRTAEVRRLAENKKGIDRSWLILRLMELGQDWMASCHMGHKTEFEWNINDEIKKAKKKKSEEDIGYMKGLQFSLNLFKEYENYVYGIGGENENSRRFESDGDNDEE